MFDRLIVGFGCDVMKRKEEMMGGRLTLVHFTSLWCLESYISDCLACSLALGTHETNGRISLPVLGVNFSFMLNFMLHRPHPRRLLVLPLQR